MTWYVWDDACLFSFVIFDEELSITPTLDPHVDPTYAPFLNLTSPDMARQQDLERRRLTKEAERLRLQAERIIRMVSGSGKRRRRVV